MESRIWIASDLRLGHHNILVEKKGTKRQDGYEEEFLSMWSRSVKKDDVVLLLGDIAFTKQAYWFDRISKLPGGKILLLGNHDKNRLNWYYKWGFNKVVPFNESLVYKHWMGNILFTHIPSFIDVLTSYDDRFKGVCLKHEKTFHSTSSILNIHGHTHGLAKERHNTFDATLDVIQNQLVTLEQILELKFKSYKNERAKTHSNISSVERSV